MTPAAKRVSKVVAIALLMLGTRAYAHDPFPPQPFTRVWGFIWYLRNTAEIDDLTLVYGGTEGSSAVVIHDYDNSKSHWFFIEGGKLFLSAGQGLPHDRETTIRGAQFTTQRPLVMSGVKDGDKRELSFLLADVYSYSLSAPPLCRHYPFLVGKGWNGFKASRAETESLCASMGLTFALSSGSPATGSVVSQTPEAGTLWESGSTTLTVTLDGSIPASIAPQGATWNTAIQVVAPSNVNSAVMSAEMTTAHSHHSFECPLLPPTSNQSEVYFRLPAAATGRLVTVSEVVRYDRLALTAWQLQGGTLSPIPWNGLPNCAALGFRPSLQFVMPSTDCFIMVEFPSRNLGDIQLKFEW